MKLYQVTFKRTRVKLYGKPLRQIAYIYWLAVGKSPADVKRQIKPMLVKGSYEVHKIELVTLKNA